MIQQKYLFKNASSNIYNQSPMINTNLAKTGHK